VSPSLHQEPDEGGDDNSEAGSPALGAAAELHQLLMGFFMWVWVNTYRYIFSGMNIHLPAILGFTRYQGFDP